MPLPALTTTVEESKALRLQRHQARYRDRGGMYVPPTDNPLMDILMARKATGESPVKRRRSNARPRQSAAAAVAAARRRSKAKAEVEEVEVDNGDEVAPAKRKGATTPKKNTAGKGKGKAKSKPKDDDAPAKKPRNSAAPKTKKAKAPVIEPATDSSDDEPLIKPSASSARSKHIFPALKREDADPSRLPPTIKPSLQPTTSDHTLPSKSKDKPIPKPKPITRKPSASAYKITRPVAAPARDDSEWESEAEPEPQLKKHASAAKPASKAKPPSKRKPVSKDKSASKDKPTSSSRSHPASSKPPSTSKLIEASPSHVPPPSLSVIGEEEEESPSAEVPLARAVKLAKRKLADDATGKGWAAGAVKKSRKDAPVQEVEDVESRTRVKAKRRGAVPDYVDPPRPAGLKKRGIPADETDENPPPARAAKRSAEDVASDIRKRSKRPAPTPAHDDDEPPLRRSNPKVTSHIDSIPSDAKDDVPRRLAKSRKHAPADDETDTAGCPHKRAVKVNSVDSDAVPLKPKKRSMANSDTEDEAPKKTKKPRSNVAQVKTKPFSRVGKENLIAREAPLIPEIRPISSPIKKPASKALRPPSKASKPPSNAPKPSLKTKPPSYRVPASTGVKRKPPPEILRRAAAPAPQMFDDERDEIDFLS